MRSQCRWNHSKKTAGKRKQGPEKSNKNSSEANSSVQHMGVSTFPSRAALHAPACPGGAALMWLQQPLPPWSPPCCGSRSVPGQPPPHPWCGQGCRVCLGTLWVRMCKGCTRVC